MIVGMVINIFDPMNVRINHEPSVVCQYLKNHMSKVVYDNNFKKNLKASSQAFLHNLGLLEGFFACCLGKKIPNEGDSRAKYRCRYAFANGDFVLGTKPIASRHNNEGGRSFLCHRIPSEYRDLRDETGFVSLWFEDAVVIVIIIIEDIGFRWRRSFFAIFAFAAIAAGRKLFFAPSRSDNIQCFW
jgi:hypothetical protein